MTLGTQGRWLRPAVILVAMLVFMLVFRQRTTSVQLAPPQALRSFAEALPTAAVGLPPVNDAPPTTAGSNTSRPTTATTAHTRMYTGAGTYTAEDVASLAEPIEAAISYVHERTGLVLSHPVNVVFDRRPGACGLDAAAFTNVRTMFLYACPDIPQSRAVNILAHEVVHQLAHDRYGEAHMQADLILSEGLATWGAGRYWLGGAPSFHDFVADNYRGNLLPLDTDSRGASTTTMNQLYYQWASFVEWIRATHGIAAFDNLYGGGVGRQPGTAPYGDVLGVNLHDAEAAWQAWLDQPAP